MKNSKFKIRNLGRAFCILIFAFLIFAFGGCSIPNLESPECTAARDGVKKFYSFHFGNDMTPSPENLKAREKFLTQELLKTLVAAGETKTDYFTASDDPPKTFKIGKCESQQPDRADLQVQTYWRDEAKVTQKEVHVEAVKTGENWLIDRVTQ